MLRSWGNVERRHVEPPGEARLRADPHRPGDADPGEECGAFLGACSLVSGLARADRAGPRPSGRAARGGARSEEHTSELQSLMRSSYAVFCLQKKKINTKIKHNDII